MHTQMHNRTGEVPAVDVPASMFVPLFRLPPSISRSADELEVFLCPRRRGSNAMSAPSDHQFSRT
jgi:hypothetical protein